MNWKEARRRYCYPETKDGVERYYAVVQGKSVEITKEMYEVMEPSYRLEWEMKYGKKAKKNKSIEQLCEQIEMFDYHGSLPEALQVPSAEDEFFMLQDAKKEDRELDRMNEEIDKLQADLQLMIRSYAEKNGCIENFAERDSVSQSAIYHRRARLGKTIARKIQEDEDDE